MNDSDVISCFGVALGHLLKEDEGIVVELPNFEKYLVVRSKGKVSICEAEDEEKDLPNGSLIWYYEEDTLH